MRRSVGVVEGPHADSVRALEGLYAVVVGLALTGSVLSVVDAQRMPAPLDGDAVPLFFAFLFTVVPFFHGAVRHLQRTYIEEGHRLVPPALLMGDFGVLFVEACLLVGLSALLGRPLASIWI